VGPKETRVRRGSETCANVEHRDRTILAALSDCLVQLCVSTVDLVLQVNAKVASRGLFVSPIHCRRDQTVARQKHLSGRTVTGRFLGVRLRKSRMLLMKRGRRSDGKLRERSKGKATTEPATVRSSAYGVAVRLRLVVSPAAEGRIAGISEWTENSSRGRM
jgi:hypothetical protein